MSFRRLQRLSRRRASLRPARRCDGQGVARFQIRDAHRVRHRLDGGRYLRPQRRRYAGARALHGGAALMQHRRSACHFVQFGAGASGGALSGLPVSVTVLATSVREFPASVTDLATSVRELPASVGEVAAAGTDLATSVREKLGSAASTSSTPPHSASALPTSSRAGAGNSVSSEERI